jgi:hypothetical protein
MLMLRMLVMKVLVKIEGIGVEDENDEAQSDKGSSVEDVEYEGEDLKMLKELVMLRMKMKVLKRKVLV